MYSDATVNIHEMRRHYNAKPKEDAKTKRGEVRKLDNIYNPTKPNRLPRPRHTILQLHKAKERELLKNRPSSRELLTGLIYISDTGRFCCVWTIRARLSMYVGYRSGSDGPCIHLLPHCLLQILLALLFCLRAHDLPLTLTVDDNGRWYTQSQLHCADRSGSGCSGLRKPAVSVLRARACCFIWGHGFSFGFCIRVGLALAFALLL